MPRRYEEPGNPQYDIGSAVLTKHRRKARNGLATLTRTDRVAYAEAVEQAVLTSQRAALRGAGHSMPKSNCSSGTFHNDGRDIHRAVLSQQRAALAAAAAQERRERTPAQWLEKYAQAMDEKRERERQARLQAA